MSTPIWYNTYQKYHIANNIDFPTNVHSLLDIFERNCELFVERTAFVQGKLRLSFADLDNYSLRLASYLQQLGLEKGSRIALMMPNVLQFPIASMAILRAGFILVNVNPLYTPCELAYQLKDSGASALIVFEMCVNTFAEIAQETVVKHTIVAKMDDLVSRDFNTQNIEHTKLPNPNTFVNTLLQGKLDNYARPTITFDDTAVLQYTGGTTGISKGAELSHQNLIANILQNDEMFKSKLGGAGAVTDNYPFFCALPLYHSIAFSVCQLLGMYKGQTNILITNPRDLANVLEAYKEHRPALFPAVNTLFNALVHNAEFQQLDHSHLKFSGGGGMAILASTAEKWQAITGQTIIEGYGLSETGPVAVFNPVEHTHFSGKIGIPLPSTHVAILDDDGNEIGIGQTDNHGELLTGEIAIKGPQVMKGYWQKPDETAKVMTNDGFFRSGDIGYMDKDGFIKIVDRKKDMILVSGFNVYPNEVESVITKHPKVLEAGVIGVTDEYSGEVPKLFVVKKDDSLTVEEILEFARQYLTSYKIPRYVVFINELPKSNVGKILRKNLREL